MNTQESELEQMYNEVQGLENGLLLAGLTVLVKDTANFVHEKGYTDAMAEEFRTVYLAMYNNDRYYWEQFGDDLYKTLPEAELPSGIVANAVKCIIDFEELKDSDPSKTIIRESTRAPGWFFFKTYSSLVQDIVLDDSSIDQEKSRVDSSQNSEFDIVKDYVERLTSRSETGVLMWSPLMLYVSLLIIRTFFVTFSTE